MISDATAKAAAISQSSISNANSSAAVRKLQADSEGSALDLIPVRMLNEFTYCPRLGYLEWVQGEWADNLETLEGSFGHRHVDKPDRKTIAAPAGKSNDSSGESQPSEAGDAKSGANTVSSTDTDDHDEPIHARSIMLSAPDEGLIAKLDLLELDGRTATPVDYKRGKVPDVPAGAYDPERVQLCAQGLILRENGYDCDEGVLYFIGSRRRITIPFDDELIALTRQNVTAFRQTATAGVCPPPLDDSPQCPRLLARHHLPAGRDKLPPGDRRPN